MLFCRSHARIEHSGDAIRDAGNVMEHTAAAMTYPLDAIPVWVFLGFTVAIFWFSTAVGYRVAVRGSENRDAPVRTIVGALLGLMAFILAITFGAALTRVNARRVLVVKEASAIATAYRSADFLPAPRALVVKRLLREYVDTRLLASEPGQFQAAIEKSEKLQSELWEQAKGIAEEAPDAAGAFVNALDVVLNVHEERVIAAIHNRVPMATWAILSFVAMTAMASVGYELGLLRTRRPFVKGALSLAFSVMLALSVDLDRPHSGIFKVSQQALIDLHYRVTRDLP